MSKGVFMPEDQDALRKGPIKKEVDNQKNRVAIYKDIVQSLGQTLAISKIYPPHHPIIKGKSREVYKKLNDFIITNGKLLFSESSEATLLVNGEELVSVDSPTARFKQTFRNLNIGSIEILPNMTWDEFLVFIDLLINIDELQEEGSVKEFLIAKKVTHIVPSFSSYRLVNENETVTKKGSGKDSVIRVEDLPPDVIKSFASDLNTGMMDEKIKSGNQIYPILAHDAESLSNVITNNMEEKDQPDQLTEILWLIGDYLIDEIQTAKQKEINTRVLNELKDKLLILYEEKKSKAKMPSMKEVDKTFTTINAALQIKGLISLYAKKIKEQEILLDKLKKIIEELPPESRLYRKAKEDWDRIDHDKFEMSLITKRNKLWPE